MSSGECGDGHGLEPGEHASMSGAVRERDACEVDVAREHDDQLRWYELAAPDAARGVTGGPLARQVERQPAGRSSPETSRPRRPELPSR